MARQFRRVIVVLGVVAGVFLFVPAAQAICQDPYFCPQPPQLDEPKDQAIATVGDKVEFGASDENSGFPATNRMTFELATAPDVDASGRFLPRAVVDMRDMERSGSSFFTELLFGGKRGAGTYYWHVIREACEFDPKSWCVENRVSAVSKLVVKNPPPKLTLRLRGKAASKGGFSMSVACSNPPCNIWITAKTSVGAGLDIERMVEQSGSQESMTVDLRVRTAKRALLRRIAKKRTVSYRVAVDSTDAFGQRATAKLSVSLRIGSSSAPGPAPTPADVLLAERKVAYRVADVFSLSRSRPTADCRRAGRRTYRCSWRYSTGRVGANYCVYEGSATAVNHGSYWGIRLYDLDNYCY